MNLKSGYPFWSIRNGLMRPYPRLEQDTHCEVAIIGGGVTAALIAHELLRHGHEVVVIEQREIGWGSTSASTALLQYEIDTPMVDLAAQYGMPAAALAYGACAKAILDLQELCDGLGGCDFTRQDSLYYASRARDLKDLQRELDARKTHALPVEWIAGDALWHDYGVRSEGAILSRLAASVDPYRLCYRLFAECEQYGGRIYDRSPIATLQAHDQHVDLRTQDGVNVRARHVIMAAGYGNQQWLSQRVARNRSSYAFVTDPLHDTDVGALKHTMMWETARPYLYVRTTADGRVVAGGEDDSIDIPARRDARVLSKMDTLLKKIAKVMPDVRLRPVFAWGGTFAETADGLPFFGTRSEHGPRVAFAMAYGGNGITYSAIGAGLLRAQLEGRAHPLSDLFGFSRLG
ncbi:NAD(P)/FAD-dependent oxidoreductase [Xanthomonas campestris]|uniref:NAD(P)/FAD-dependent oxidoreductase n=1 Tax=Xanthomonas campestris TaxID=339 RepID=UPI002367797A|nr:FAD-dependent oxidoreductase [Xanthomonas campestris]WDK84919.1 FAD-binding oxidoreductase [Xanthomonas campestris pv. campestris]WDK85540.1 FAD-binding oxidoreductase [Xanthomonas campestris pv. campestris]WDK89679.1 FAD-binding oxidoreductase [Xanthomonas campestris pv. campestris]WDL40093.1 FAD-binding oxidoreductase [Xanthomonas campestris pv. campestris]